MGSSEETKPPAPPQVTAATEMGEVDPMEIKKTSKIAQQEREGVQSTILQPLKVNEPKGTIMSKKKKKNDNMVGMSGNY